jgi:hypothetical protein
MTFELWNTASANMVGDYATEADALKIVRQSVAVHGAAYVDAWVLVCTDDESKVTTVAESGELARLAARGVRA